MAIIDLPLSDIGIETRSAGSSTSETILRPEAEHALGQAALFLDNTRLAETKIVNAEDYSARPNDWDEVIGSAYEHFGSKPTTTEDRRWTPLGSEAEEGWMSNDVKTIVRLDNAGKYIALRLIDTIVERPDGSQKRLLYANRMGMPILPSGNDQESSDK